MLITFSSCSLCVFAVTQYELKVNKECNITEAKCINAENK